MTVITDIKKIIDQVGRWCPSDVAYIRHVSFENCEQQSFDMVLKVLLQPRLPLSTGWPDPNGTFWEVEIAFYQVQNLSLTMNGPWDIQTPGFALDDIRDRQWEGINLLVYDYERLAKEEINFGARSAQVRNCRPALCAPNSPNLWREYPGEFDGTKTSVL